MQKVLGLDLGTNSIGWCLVTYQESEPAGFIDAGVRVFLEGVNERGESKNLKRRTARQIRRNHQRRNRRKILLRQMLKDLKWMPENESGLVQWYSLNPYQLRRKALDEKITLPEQRLFLIKLDVK